jgi:hypothetical protein
MISEHQATTLQTAIEPTMPQSSTASDETENRLPERSQKIAAVIQSPQASTPRPDYRSVPADWRTIPPGRFTNVIGHLEAVLLDITVDRTVTSNAFDWKPTLPTLQAWAEHLRAALNALTK